MRLSYSTGMDEIVMQRKLREVQIYRACYETKTLGNYYHYSDFLRLRQFLKTIHEMIDQLHDLDEAYINTLDGTEWNIENGEQALYDLQMSETIQELVYDYLYLKTAKGVAETECR